MKAAAYQDDWMGRPSTVLAAMIIAALLSGLIVGLTFDGRPCVCVEKR